VSKSVINSMGMIKLPFKSKIFSNMRVLFLVGQERRADIQGQV
jgi:hypothetical protein